MANSNEDVLGTLIILGFSFTYIMYNIINLPFVNFYQNYRANICHITQLITLIVSNYYRSMKYNIDPLTKSKIYTPTKL